MSKTIACLLLSACSRPPVDYRVPPDLGADLVEVDVPGADAGYPERTPEPALDAGAPVDFGPEDEHWTCNEGGVPGDRVCWNSCCWEEACCRWWREIAARGQVDDPEAAP